MDDALASTVGAVMAVAFVVSLLAVVQLEFVPVWEEDREASHAEAVLNQLIALRSQMDRQLHNRSAAPVSTPMDVGLEEAGRFFGSTNLRATLSFEPASVQTAVASNRLLQQTKNGVSLAGINETWVDITTGDALDNITQVQHLRIRVDDPANADGGDFVALNVTDANGGEAGQYKVLIRNHPSGYSVNSIVTDANGNVVFDGGESFFGQHQPDFYWIDAMDESHLFDQVLAAADAPFALRLQEFNMTGDYTAAYTQEVASGGEIQVGSSGKVITDYNDAFIGGRLTHALVTNRFVDQTFVMEHGAIIIDQDGDAVMRVEPAFRTSYGSDTVRVTWSLPSLVGDRDERSSGGTHSLSTASTNAVALTAQVPSYEINLTTDHPSLWSAFWEGRLEAVGLREASGHFDLASGPDWARVVIYGPVTAPTSTAYDLNIVFAQATLDLDIA